MSITAALEQVAAELTAAGVPTAIDPRDVNLPGGWIQHVSHAADLLAPGCLTVRLRVLLISPDTGTLEALKHLDALEAAALDAFTLNTSTPVTDRTALLPDSGTPYPARVLESDVQLRPTP